MCPIQVAVDPQILMPFSHLGETDELRVQDSAAFAAAGEELSFWELMVRPHPRNAVALPGTDARDCTGVSGSLVHEAHHAPRPLACACLSLC